MQQNVLPGEFPINWVWNPIIKLHADIVFWGSYQSGGLILSAYCAHLVHSDWQEVVINIQIDRFPMEIISLPVQKEC